jgi:DNA-directed RNA polymerase subunit RPC12/RpoP
MAKKKDHAEVEHLRGLNRQLVKKIKQLQKEVGRTQKLADKTIAEYNNFVEPSEIEEYTTVHCSKCKSPNVSIIDMNVRTVKVCLECGHRESQKNEEEPGSSDA